MTTDCKIENGPSVTLVRPVQRDSTTNHVTGWRLVVVLVSLSLGTLLVAIDNTILAVAIPEITAVFHSLDDVGWYGSSYLLTVTALQPTFGTWFKYFSVKWTYLTCVVIFEVGSLLCAIAPSSPVFILGRAIAGIGAAGLFQGAIYIVACISPLEKRPLYLGLVVSVFGASTCFGPILGGALTTDVIWRWCFWINLPIGVPVFFLILLVLRLHDGNNELRSRSLKTKVQNLDLAGTILFVSSICCIVFALQWGGSTDPWSSSRVIGCFVGFGILMILFLLDQWFLGERATIPLRIMGQRSVLCGSLFVFFLNASNYLDGYFMPFYFQAVQGTSPTTSGIRFISLALPVTLMIGLSGALTTRTGNYVIPMLVCTVIGSVGTGLLSTIAIDTPTVKWAAYLVVTGIGIGIGVQMPLTAVQAVLSETDVPIGNAIAVFFIQFGGALAVPVGETILTNTLSSQIPQLTRAVPVSTVTHAGAGGLSSVTTDPTVLLALRMAYSTAVKNVLYLSTAMIAVSIMPALRMEWINVKRVGEQKKRIGEGEAESLDTEEKSGKKDGSPMDTRD